MSEHVTVTYLQVLDICRIVEQRRRARLKGSHDRENGAVKAEVLHANAMLLKRGLQLLRLFGRFQLSWVIEEAARMSKLEV